MKDIIKSQYKASLAMLRGAIAKCDDALWASADYKHPFWRVAYHALFYTDLYLTSSLDRFTPWSQHVDELEALGPMIHKGGKTPKDGPPYAKSDIEAYYALVVKKVDTATDAIEDMDAGSGFFWLPFSKLELQFYNIRHVQHHAGQLIERIRQELDESVDWIPRG